MVFGPDAGKDLAYRRSFGSGGYSFSNHLLPAFAVCLAAVLAVCFMRNDLWVWAAILDVADPDAGRRSSGGWLGIC